VNHLLDGIETRYPLLQVIRAMTKTLFIGLYLVGKEMQR
jgi:hypothetical protein